MSSNLLSYKFFRYGAAWIIFFIGVGLYALGYFGIKQDSIWKEIIIKFADVLVIGVIIGYLSNAAQFLGVFKQDLQDIIYGKEFIQQRKDVYPLWEILSKQMFKNKFPTLHKDFLKVISDYFPKDEISYYNDYEKRTTINWVDKEKGIIKVTDIASFELIAETTEAFTYPIKTWTKVTDMESFQNKTIEFSVNGESKIIADWKKTIKNDVICQEQNVELSGYNKYDIQYTREKIYNMNEDYYIGFRASYIVNNLRVCLEYPDGIDATFICRGTQQDFDDIRHVGSKKCIERKYKGIILPRQGYIFALRKIN